MAEAVKQNPATAVAPPTVTFTLDGRQVTVPKGTTILIAAQQQGIEIPTFCWHPKLSVEGACRMCYVEIEKWPKLAISCATEAMDGMVVRTDSEKVKQGRRAVIEFTLIDHPLDCPTCDKGGECTLQDLTFAHGYDDSRFEFQKRRFGIQEAETTFDEVRIGPEIILNRNRCIRCYRCTRANKEAFGEHDLGAFERGNHTEINAAPGRRVDNPFSGNLVEICPVGALINTDWRYKIRVWLTQTTSSICPFHSSGANILFFKNDHQGRIFRVTSRPNDDIDDGWITDVTRYGYQIVTSEDRLRRPLVKKGGKQVEASWEEAMEVIRDRLGEIIEKKGRVCIGGLVSPTLDNASLFSFSKLFRTVIGSNNIDFRLDYRMLPTVSGGAYDILCSRPFSIADIEKSDLIVTLGSDLVREHPNEYLKMRRACNFGGATVYALNPYQTKSADIARAELVYQPGTEEIAINGICLAAIENNLVDSSRIGDLRKKITPGSSSEAARLCGVDASLFTEVASALAHGSRVTLFAGEIVSRSRDREAIASALCNLNRLFELSSKGQIAILPRYANSRGAGKLGLLPEPPTSLKTRLKEQWGEWPETAPMTTDQMLLAMKKEEINSCLVIGGNPVMLYPDREFAHDALEGLDFLVVADLFETETSALADVVLPLCSWAEYDGYYVNLEGRVQLASRALPPRFESKPGYEIAQLIAEHFEKPLFESPEERDRMIRDVLMADPGVELPDRYLEVRAVSEDQPAGYPVVLFMGDDLHHSGHVTEKAASLVNFCGEAYVEMSPLLAERLGLNAGDSARVESEVGKVVAPVRISRYIRNDVVFMPRNFSAFPVNSLLMRKRRVDRVKISKVVG
ncbi:MAG: NADH-quinone oxidoreductase subunit NuoG [Candidatus Zixiibacteriota bacterium]